MLISQMEKAANHYNSKKQLLQESQEEVAQLKQSLEVKEREVKAITTENKMLQLDLDKAQTNEKKLMNVVASLEAQVGITSLSVLSLNKEICCICNISPMSLSLYLLTFSWPLLTTTCGHRTRFMVMKEV